MPKHPYLHAKRLYLRALIDTGCTCRLCNMVLVTLVLGNKRVIMHREYQTHKMWRNVHFRPAFCLTLKNESPCIQDSGKH